MSTPERISNDEQTASEKPEEKKRKPTLEKRLSNFSKLGEGCSPVGCLVILGLALITFVTGTVIAKALAP
jgi:hypothetical protein